MEKPEKCLIACPIFKDELEIMLPSNVNFNLHFMDFRVHNDAQRMFQELDSAVHSAGNCNIALLVGRECYCETPIADFAKSVNARIVNEKNCIEAILGPERADVLQQHRTTIHTKGWMRMIRQFVADDGLNADSIRMMLGFFDRILLIDYGINAFSDDDIIAYYDLLQVPIQIEPVQLSYFRGVLSRLLEWPE